MTSFVRLAIPEVILVTPARFTDPRGYFSETYVKDRWAQNGIVADFVQDNESLSEPPGTLRGLHFQSGAAAQAKLVRPVQGEIFDVAVDLRRGSPTYGRWVGVKLTAAGGEQLFVPRGFAHGFCSLVPETKVQYKVDSPYARECEGGIMWNDPDIGIEWPVAEPILSDKDRVLPRLKEFDSPFVYG